MSSKKLPIARRRGAWPAFAVVLAGVGAVQAGCGAVKVQPTAAAGSTTLVSRGKVDSPMTAIHNHLGCLRADHLTVQIVSATKLQIGGSPSGPTVVFTPTAGAAQAQQIDGDAQGAEAIGPALLYPNQGLGLGADGHRGLPGSGRAGIGASRMPRDAGARCAGSCMHLPLPCVTWRARHQSELPGPLVCSHC